MTKKKWQWPDQRMLDYNRGRRRVEKRANSSRPVSADRKAFELGEGKMTQAEYDESMREWASKVENRLSYGTALSTEAASDAAEAYRESSGTISPVFQHRKLCAELNILYARKNHDYGNSFHETYREEGMAMPRIRLTDKLNRFKSLTKSNRLVETESIRDTLIDLANYALMTVMEIGNGKEKWGI